MPSLTSRQWGWIGITLLIYSMLLGWKLALAIVITIAFHEYCHLLMAHKLGLQTRGFTMIPFIGGFSFIISEYKTYYQQAKVALAGPIGGGVLSLLVFGIYLVTKIPFFAGVGYWMAVVNLTNLLPITALDGGLLMNTISFSFNKNIGIQLMVFSTTIAAIFAMILNPIVAVIIVILGIAGIRREYIKQNSYDEVRYPLAMSGNLALKIWTVWCASFFILLVFCLSLCNSPLVSLTTLLSSK